MLLSRRLCSAGKHFPRTSRLRSSRQFSGDVTNEIVEGSAKMLHTEKDPVFYNNIQGINRDMSIQVINLFSETIEAERRERRTSRKTNEIITDSDSSQSDAAPDTSSNTGMGISILEALAATGLRSVRYIQEIPSIGTLVLNDLSTEATETAKRTLSYNEVDMDRVVIQNKDANDLMHEYRRLNTHFDVIDIDPYGSSAPFLDAAVQAVAGDGGLLCLTCTDYATLCGVHPATSLGRYGTLNFPTDFKAEVALRTLLHAVDSAANRHQRYIVPWISVSIDYYVRVFVRVYKSKLEVKNSPLRRLMLYQAENCPSFHVHALGKLKKQPDGQSKAVVNMFTLPATCEQTGGRWKVGGPFWGGPLHSQVVVDELLRRVKGPALSKHLTTTNAVFTESAENINNPASPMNENHDNAEENLPMTTIEAEHIIPTARRLIGILTSISMELKDVPFFYALPELASAMKCKTPKYAQIEAAIVNAGYRVSNFHHDPNAIKTDAPDRLIWDIMRTYCLSSERGAPPSNLPPTAQKIRAVPCTFRPDFAIKKNGKAVHSDKKVARFLQNEPNWGPRSRARPTKTVTKGTTEETVSERDNEKIA